MGRSGKRLEKLERVRGPHGATIRELYSFPNGQTVRLRTNAKRALMTKSVGVNSGDKLILEGPQDYIGLAIPGPRGTVECYVIPQARAMDDLRSAHRVWQETQPDGGKSYLRHIYFPADPRRPASSILQNLVFGTHTPSLHYPKHLTEQTFSIRFEL